MVPGMALAADRRRSSILDVRYRILKVLDVVFDADFEQVAGCRSVYRDEWSGTLLRIACGSARVTGSRHVWYSLNSFPGVSPSRAFICFGVGGGRSLFLVPSVDFEVAYGQDLASGGSRFAFLVQQRNRLMLCRKPCGREPFLHVDPYAVFLDASRGELLELRQSLSETPSGRLKDSGEAKALPLGYGR